MNWNACRHTDLASRWARLFVLAALASPFPGCPPSPPPTPPTPPPSPTPLPSVRIEGNRFVPSLEGAVLCCDDPRTPDVDEGLRDGWTLATDQALDGLAAARVNVTHYRTGPYNLTGPTGARLASARDRLKARLLDVSVKAYGPGPDILPDLRKSVQAANARGIYVEVDLVDNWALVNGWNFHSDDCSVTRRPPNDNYRGWVDAVVASTGDLAVLYNLGNEGFRCNPSPEWERGLYEAAKASLASHGFPDRPVGSQVLLPDTRVAFDYRTLGGVFLAPTAMEIPVALTEDDGGDHTPEQWRAVTTEARSNGTYVMIWRGRMSDRDFERAVRER